MNSRAKIAVNIIFNISKALLYSTGWLWYFIASVIVLIMMRTKMAYSNGCDVTNHQTLYWIRCFGMYLGKFRQIITIYSYLYDFHKRNMIKQDKASNQFAVN